MTIHDHIKQTRFRLLTQHDMVRLIFQYDDDESYHEVEADICNNRRNGVCPSEYAKYLSLDATIRNLAGKIQLRAKRKAGQYIIGLEGVSTAKVDKITEQLCGCHVMRARENRRVVATLKDELEYGHKKSLGEKRRGKSNYKQTRTLSA